MIKTAGLCIFCVCISLNARCQPDLQKIDSLMKTYYSSRLPGAVIGIQYHGKTIFIKGYGSADLSTNDPVTAATIFNIGSLTKQFTAYAVLKLVRLKKILLTDRLDHYFPSLPPSISKKITIQQLLSHCSGIPDHYGYTDTLQVRHATDKDVLTALEKADTLLFTPGTGYRYSNTAYCLLGLLIEKCSGTSYEQFVRQEIFNPLRMNNSSVFNISKRRNGVAKSYTSHGKDGFAELDADQSIFFSTEADGGMLTTIGDYLAWCHSLQAGYLDNSVVAQQWTPHTVVDSLQGLAYGYGWFIAGEGRNKSIYHTGSNGGFRTVCYMRPAENYAVAIFSNRDDIDLENIVMRINQFLNVGDNSFLKSLPLESFIHCWPIFAPCKETRLYSISSTGNWSASVTDWNSSLRKTLPRFR